MESSLVETDVLIVGAGASGGVAAHSLAANGVDVLCLEQGEWPDAAQFTGRRADWEVVAATRWSPNPNVRLLESDYPVDVAECPLEPMMYNAVGGSTVLWGAVWHRLTPSDFKVRTLDGVAADWPLRYDDLAGYYDRIEADMGVSGHDGDPAYPEHAPYPLPALPIGAPGERFARAMNAMGWHWWPASNAIPSRAYRGRNACLRRGTCMIGCADGAKASSNLTHWPEAIANGARLITGARVKEITLDAQGLASGAIHIDRSGSEQRVKAKVVILCANGIGTPRLLLMSQSSRFSHGLANSSGRVGRGLMLHPTGLVTGRTEEDIESWRGPFGHLAYSMEFYNTDPARGFVRGSKWSVIPHGGPLAMAIGMEDGGVGQGAMASRFGKTLMIAIFGEDLPDEDNRVVLSDELVDSDDLPAPKIIYRVGENTRRLLGFNVERAKEVLATAGATDISGVPYHPANGGAHLLGSARMGEDPEQSVVDRWCRSHDVPNLYIFDGSVFPTSGAVNPTATICAIALRGAERLFAGRRDQKTAA